MKTAKLTGVALDWAVAKSELMNGADYTLEVDRDVDGMLRVNFGGMYPEWSTDWQEGGAIIERERIELRDAGGDGWAADDNLHATQYGNTPLMAAMRCYVASKLGEEIEIPGALL